VWAQEYGAFIPESLRPATALHRVAMTDVDGPAYDDHRSWITPDIQLARCVNRWFDDVRTWAEVVTGQDLDPNHRVYDAELDGVGQTHAPISAASLVPSLGRRPPLGDGVLVVLEHLRGLQLHLLPAGSALHGQPAAIRIAHDTGLHLAPLPITQARRPCPTRQRPQPFKFCVIDLYRLWFYSLNQRC
jgi:hypothetical protein